MTNTPNVKCSDCGTSYKHQDNSKCPKCGSGNRTLTLIINERESILENNVISLVMIFDLYDNVQIGGNITNSQNLEFVADPEHPGTIKQFLIKLDSPTSDDEKKALEKASEITNYLSVKVNRTVKHKLPLIRRIMNDKMTNTISYRVDTVLHKNFDLDANYLESKLLNKTSDLNKRLQLYNRGLGEFENNNFTGSIQSFHQCIEGTQLTEEEQFRPLRHAVSHQRIDDTRVIEELTKIGIKITKNESLNENDPDNQNILSSKACILKQVVFKYLESELSNL